MKIDEIGPLLYGKHWQTPLAKAMGFTNMTLYRWTQDGIPPDRIPLVKDTIQRRYHELYTANNGGIRPYDLAHLIWPFAARARVSELTGVSLATLSRAGSDWRPWADTIEGVRRQMLADVQTWAAKQEV